MQCKNEKNIGMKIKSDHFMKFFYMLVYFSHGLTLSGSVLYHTHFL
jgi:hypothetical protein